MEQFKMVNTIKRARRTKNRQGTINLLIRNLPLSTKAENEQAVRSIQMLFALELFDSKQYDQSMKDFLKLKVDPAEVIKLFPKLDCLKLKSKDIAEEALDALIFYLEEVKSKLHGTSLEEAGFSSHEHELNMKQQLEMVDTTLLKCYLQKHDDASVFSLLDNENNCCLEESEKVLLQYGKHDELITMYQKKDQHSKALQLLQEQVKRQTSGLKGYDRTIKYLQNLGVDHIDLIFKFSDWILEESPKVGLTIFTDDIGEVKKLPRLMVLDYLLKQHKYLVMPYLEHVIYVWEDETTALYDALIEIYIEQLNKCELKQSNEYKCKLRHILETCMHYDPKSVLSKLPYDSLFGERAVVLGRLGREKEALAIFIHILGDVDEALRYCESVSKNRKTNIYVILLEMLMNPNHSVLDGPLAEVPRHPKSTVVDLERCFNILDKHVNDISPLEALPLFPDSVPLCRLKCYIESALETRLTTKRRSQATKTLLHAVLMQNRAMKSYCESKSIVIHNNDACAVCKKRFIKQSAIVRYPNGAIVHFSCKVDVEKQC